MLGPDHPNTLTALTHIARFRGKAGDAAGAATLSEELLADEERVLGPDHPDSLITRNNVARCGRRTGDAAGAATAYEQLLACLERMLGPDTPTLSPP
nr:tetratricopeptide repeat protein [Streptomyces afghaniensis]